MAWSDGILLKITNIVLFLWTLGSNVYSVATPEDLPTVKDTFVSPTYAFQWTWTLIHLLLIGFLIYQFTESGKRIIIDGLGWRFALLALLSGLWAHLSIRGWHVLSFILSLLVSASVSTCYLALKQSHSGENLTQELFIHLPFSLWHAFAVVLVVISGFVAFGKDAHLAHPGIWTKVFCFLAFVFVESTAAAYAFSTREGDAAGAAVLAFYLFSVFEHQHSKFIRWSAFAFFILSLFAILKSLYGTFRSSSSPLHDEERAPLVQGSD